MITSLQARTLHVNSPAIPEILGQPALVPVRLSGREGLNTLFAYELQLTTRDDLHLTPARAANFKREDFINRELTVKIELEGSGRANLGAGTREINGIISHVKLLEPSGRFMQYQLSLRPWLYQASQNSDCRIYQNQTVVDILDTVLSKYHFPVEKRLIERYPRRDYQTQFNESDYQFFCRLCEEWGINWFFEHSQGKHRLVLIDNMAGHKKNPSAAYQQIPFHPDGGLIDTEYLQHFTPAHSLTATRYTTKDSDYTRPKADLTVQRHDPDAPGQAEVYEWHVDSHYSQPQAGTGKEGNDPLAEGAFLARLRLEAIRQEGQQANGSGPLRGMVPGCSFRLEQHPHQAANTDYLITAATLLIEDVAQVTQAPGQPLQQYRVHVDIDTHPLRQPCRPRRHTPKPYIYGPHAALVVGPPDQNIWTDQYGRIKVQFPWDRNGQQNQDSSCWIRVLSSWAGNQLGALHLPRIGQEVIVDFMGGDPDLPLCIGSVYNQSNLPPWQQATQSALSGLRSRELTKNGGNAAAGRSNHLIFDDTEGQIQTQLKSDHQHSQLSLGRITRIEDKEGRKEARGEGFEVRTDGAGTVRAGKGLLLTADGCAKAVGGILSRDELIDCLEQALTIARQLGQSAAEHQGSQRNTQAQQDLTQAVDALGHGSGDETERNGKTPAGQALIAISAPAGIASATPKDQVHYAGQNIDSVAGKNQQHYAMNDILHTATRNIEHHAIEGDLRQIANQGKFIAQAQHNSMELTADQTLTVTAVNDGIVLQAGQHITFKVGDSFIKIIDGAITFDAKAINFQSLTCNFIGPKGAQTQMPAFSLGKLVQPQLKGHYIGNKPHDAMTRKFKMINDDSEIAKASSASDGSVASAS